MDAEFVAFMEDILERFLFVMDRVAIKPTGGGDFPSLSAGFGEG